MTEDDKDFETRLGQAIRQLAKERVFVPSSKDEKIIAGIRNRHERRNRELGKGKAPAKRKAQSITLAKVDAAGGLYSYSCFHFLFLNPAEERRRSQRRRKSRRD